MASAVSLVSITLGTPYRRRYCGGIDWRSSNLVAICRGDRVLYDRATFLFEAARGAFGPANSFTLAWPGGRCR